ARPVGRLERGWRWCRRNPLAATLATALVLAALGGFAVVTSLWLRAESATKLAQERGKAARRYWYFWDMSRASLAWADADVARVLKLLERQKPGPGEDDLRGFEWYYLWRLSHSDRATLRGHVDSVRCAALSPDGKTLATGGGGIDRTVKLWDAATGELRGTLQ